MAQQVARFLFLVLVCARIPSILTTPLDYFRGLDGTGPQGYDADTKEFEHRFEHEDQVGRTQLQYKGKLLDHVIVLDTLPDAEIGACGNRTLVIRWAADGDLPFHVGQIVVGDDRWGCLSPEGDRRPFYRKVLDMRLLDNGVVVFFTETTDVLGCFEELEVDFNWRPNSDGFRQPTTVKLSQAKRKAMAAERRPRTVIELLERPLSQAQTPEMISLRAEFESRLRKRGFFDWVDDAVSSVVDTVSTVVTTVSNVIDSIPDITLVDMNKSVSFDLFNFNWNDTAQTAIVADNLIYSAGATQYLKDERQQSFDIEVHCLNCYAYLRVNMNFQLKLTVGLKGVHMPIFKFVIGGNFKMNFDVTASIEYQYSQSWDKQIGPEKELSPWIFAIGPVPVYIVPKLSLHATLDFEADITASLSAGFDYSAALSPTGIERVNDNWQPVSPVLTTNGNLHPVVLDIEGQANFTLGLMPQVTFEFYTIIGITVSLGPYVKLVLDASIHKTLLGQPACDDPNIMSACYATYWGVKLGVTLEELSILDHKFGSPYLPAGTDWDIIEDKVLTPKKCIASNDTGIPCFYWTTSAWGGCQPPCGIVGSQTRLVTCMSTVSGQPTDESNCDPDSKPDTLQLCGIPRCPTPPPPPAPLCGLYQTMTDCDIGGYTMGPNRYANSGTVCCSFCQSTANCTAFVYAAPYGIGPGACTLKAIPAGVDATGNITYAKSKSCWMNSAPPTTGLQTTGVRTTALGTTRAPTTGVQTTGVQTTGVQTTGVQTTGVRTTGVQTTGLRTTGLQTTGVRTTGVRTTGAPVYSCDNYPIETDGRCGLADSVRQTNRMCNSTKCCSRFGWCGNGPDYCGASGRQTCYDRGPVAKRSVVGDGGTTGEAVANFTKYNEYINTDSGEVAYAGIEYNFTWPVKEHTHHVSLLLKPNADSSQYFCGGGIPCEPIPNLGFFNWRVGYGLPYSQAYQLVFVLNNDVRLAAHTPKFTLDAICQNSTCASEVSPWIHVDLHCSRDCDGGHYTLAPSCLNATGSNISLSTCFPGQLPTTNLTCNPQRCPDKHIKFHNIGVETSLHSNSTFDIEWIGGVLYGVVFFEWRASKHDNFTSSTTYGLPTGPVPNTGTYSWHIPHDVATSTAFQIRISSRELDSNNSYISRPFKIVRHVNITVVIRTADDNVGLPDSLRVGLIGHAGTARLTIPGPFTAGTVSTTMTMAHDISKHILSLEIAQNSSNSAWKGLWALATVDHHYAVFGLFNNSVDNETAVSVQNCYVFSTCSECNRHQGCGWCNHGGCEAGTSAGPFAEIESCPAGHWNDTCVSHRHQFSGAIEDPFAAIAAESHLQYDAPALDFDVGPTHVTVKFTPAAVSAHKRATVSHIDLSNVAAIDLQMAIGSGNYTTIFSASTAEAFNHTVTGLSAGTAYTFRLVFIESGGTQVTTQPQTISTQSVTTQAVTTGSSSTTSASLGNAETDNSASGQALGQGGIIGIAVGVGGGVLVIAAVVIVVLVIRRRRGSGRVAQGNPEEPRDAEPTRVFDKRSTASYEKTASGKQRPTN